MFRTLLILTLAVLPTVLRAQAGTTPAAKRPNIVMVLMGGQRWDDLGYAGHPFVETPNIDRLARAGAVLEHAFVTTPEPEASQSGFLTGRHARPMRLGIPDGATQGEPKPDRVMFTHQLQESGYRTAFMGRARMSPDHLARSGFGVSVVLAGPVRYSNPQIEIGGRRESVQGYVTDVLTDHAVRFIRQRQGSPFCLVLSHEAVTDAESGDAASSVRGPMAGRSTVPAPRHQGLYADRTPPRRPNHGAPSNKAALARGPNTFAADDAIRDRLRALAAVDESIGRMLRVLEEERKLADTVFIFASDGGYLYGEHGAVGQAQLAYEESIHIPLIIAYPRKIRAGQSLLEPVLNVDIAPTVLEFAEESVPKEMHGGSLAPLLRGDDYARRHYFLIESFTNPAQPDAERLDYQAVGSLRLKYIRYPGLGGAEELYDLHADPYEMTNMAGRESAKNELRSMRGRLEALLKEAR